MKKKPGLFDPWRQAAPPPLDETPTRKTPTEFARNDSAGERCIQFNGLRAGVYVWMSPKEEDDSLRARAMLVDVIHRISSREVIAKILHSWGVYTGTPKQPNAVVLASGDKKMTISSPASDERLVPGAVDSLSLALREIAQQFPDVRDMLSALRVHPYLK